MTGEGKHVNICLDCGTIWAASELKKTLDVVRTHTGKQLDLREDADRVYLKDFMVAIEPVILQGAEAEKKATDLCGKADKIESTLSDDVTPKFISQPSGSSGGAGCGYGLLLSVALFMGAVGIGISSANPLLIVLVLAVPLIGLLYDATQTSETRAYKKKLESETKRWEAERDRLIAIRDARTKEAASLRDAANKLRLEAEQKFSEKLGEFLNSHG